MIARLDHHPMLTALLALTTAVLFVVVITLATLLITSVPASSPPNIGGGGHLGALSGEAGSSEGLAEAHGTSADEHAQVVAAYTGKAAPQSSLDEHARMVAAYER